MMSRRFQFYVSALILLVVVLELSVWLLVPRQGIRFDLLIVQGYHFFGGGDFLIYAVLLLTHIACLIGLVRFNPVARLFFLVYVSFVPILGVLFELGLVPYFGIPVTSVLWLFDVAIVILSYASLAKIEFGAGAT